MASGINNACRLTGVAVGVAALGAVLEDRISTSLVSSLGPRGESLASAVAATGTRVAAEQARRSRIRRRSPTSAA